MRYTFLFLELLFGIAAIISFAYLDGMFMTVFVAMSFFCFGIACGYNEGGDKR